MNKSNVKLFLNHSKWIILAGGSLFFLIRALYLASTGGDTFCTINPVFSWILLFTEISFSGITVSVGIVSLISWTKELNQIKLLHKRNLKNVVLFTGISTYIVHLIRVAIWLSL